MKVKICGITNQEDANNAIVLGANAIGFIFTPKSPRQVKAAEVEKFVKSLPPFVQIVGVFLDQSLEEIKEISERCCLDVVQLHGQESPAFCREVGGRVIKAFKVGDIEDIQQIPHYKHSVSAVLLDSKVKNEHGGTGQSFDWGIALAARELDIPLILAGGINAKNIKKAIQLVSPYGLDLSSGVEQEVGKKDYNKMAQLLKLAKEH